jgi:hypothetical protein
VAEEERAGGRRLSPGRSPGEGVGVGGRLAVSRHGMCCALVSAASEA